MKKIFTDAELDSLHERTCYAVLHGGLGEQLVSDLLAAITQLREERDTAHVSVQNLKMAVTWQEEIEKRRRAQ